MVRRTMILRDLIGHVKDKASLSRAALLSKPNSTHLPLKLAVLRATTHDPNSPQKHIDALLSVGDGSRAAASALVHALIDRLHSTRDAVVALKCLHAAHHIVKRGGFILQDQLSVFPAAGGRNYLKLSAFRDDASPGAWQLSAWVRWYAAYLELILSNSRSLGFFLGCSPSCGGAATTLVEIDRKEERVVGLINSDLIREVDLLVSLIGEIDRVPNESSPTRVNSLVKDIVGLLGDDCFLVINELSLRVEEFKNRFKLLSFGESVELSCGLRRLEECKERLTFLFVRKGSSMEEFWVLISEVKHEAAKIKASKEEGRNLAEGKRRVSESARFDERFRLSLDNVGRFSFRKLEPISSR